MTTRTITCKSPKDALPHKGETDRERLRRQDEAGLEPDRDPGEGAFDRSRPKVTMPRPREAIMIRLDANLIDFFHGPMARDTDAGQRDPASLHASPSGLGRPVHHSDSGKGCVTGDGRSIHCQNETAIRQRLPGSGTIWRRVA